MGIRCCVPMMRRQNSLLGHFEQIIYLPISQGVHLSVKDNNLIDFVKLLCEVNELKSEGSHLTSIIHVHCYCLG